MLLILAAGLLVRPDLSRQELPQYISPASKFMTLSDGSEVHYRDEGNLNGPVVVLIHGGFGSLHNWETWLPHLSDQFRVISMDLPGHGLTGWVTSGLFHRDSNVSVVAEVLDTLGIDSFTLTGHSMGGGVALLYTLNHPERVERLVLIGSEGVTPEGGHRCPFSTQKRLWRVATGITLVCWSWANAALRASTRTRVRLRSSIVYLE